MNKEQLATEYLKSLEIEPISVFVLANYKDDTAICAYIWNAYRDGFDAAKTPLVEVLKKVNLAIQHSNLKDTILHVEVKEAIKNAE